jgi:hypothetical protein
MVPPLRAGSVSDRSLTFPALKSRASFQPDATGVMMLSLLPTLASMKVAYVSTDMEHDEH